MFTQVSRDCMIIITIIIIANIYQALTLPRTFLSLPHLILSEILSSDPHFTDEETEDQRSKSHAQSLVICIH